MLFYHFYLVSAKTKSLFNMTNKQDNIAIIIILFNPKREDVDNIKRLSIRYEGVIVDNSCPAIFNEDKVNRMYYIAMKDNVGIAKAQNIGIQKALQNNDIDYLVFMDQDSTMSDSYPTDIVAEFKNISSSVPNLAFLGPRINNKETGKEYKSIIHKDKKTTAQFIPRREVISSGGCTTREIMSVVGYNDESLFIDFVDFEWCWRARSKNYVCGISSNIIINHKVGRKTLSIGGFFIIISAPFRYYYQFRNHLWLIRKKYVPLQWKINIGIKHLARLLYFPLFIESGIECWKYMIKGIAAGLKRHETF